MISQKAMGMKNKKPLVVLVIPNYNGEVFLFKNRPMLKVCLESLKKTRYPNFKIVVSDDGSTDKSEKLVKRFKGVDFVENNPKRGFFAKNTNNGIRFALKKYDPDYVMGLNTDIIVSDRLWLTKMVDTAERDKRIGVMNPKLVYPDNTMQYGGLEMKWGVLPILRGRDGPVGAYASIDEMEALSGMLFIKRNVIDKVGLFDENFVMGMEDLDYSLRAKKAGFKLIYDGRASLIHIENFTTNKSENGNDVWFAYQQFNYAYFAFKHFGIVGRAKSLFLTFFLRTFLRIGNDGIKLNNIKLRDRIPWRVRVSLHELMSAYRCYKNDIAEKWLEPGR
jgi:hypothetical protein